MKSSFFFHTIVNMLNILPPVGKSLGLRGKFVSRFISGGGDNLKLSSNVNIYNPAKLRCGRNVYIGYNTYIGGGNVFLEDEVIIGPFCCIVAGNHSAKNGSFRYGPYLYGEITIGRGTWLGAHVTITSNVKIGRGCLICAGAVVTKDVPDYTMVGGVPAKEIKKLPEYE